MNKQILNIAVPNIISNITIPLLGFVDLALMGHLGKVDFIGAVALGGIIFNFLYWGFSFLRMGTTGITAQAYGARNLKESILSLSRALFVAFAGSLLILVLQKPIENLSFWLIESEESVEQIAKSYFRIRIWAAPASIALYALNGWFIGMQNAKIPMLTALVGNVMNILLSAFFVYSLKLEAKGVALGTLIAQYLSLFLSLCFIFTSYKKMFKYFSIRGLVEIQKLKHFFTINKDIFIRTLCIIFVFTFFTTESASKNKEILALNSLLLQFLFIFSYFMDGFAFAAEALVGKFIGGGHVQKLSKAVRYLFYWGVAVSLIFTLIYATFGTNLLSLLTNNELLVELSRQYLPWLVMLPILSFASFLMDGIFIGATASAYMRKIMMISTIGIFLPIYFFLHPLLENHALWMAMLAFMLARGVLQIIYYKKAVLQNKNDSNFY